MRKRKKGSSFVIVLAITSMIFVVGASILTMVASDYKNRINESKRVQNLYEADSGLDIVYNLIIKNSEAAILEAGSEVESMPYSDTSNYETFNTAFKAEFVDFLGNETNDTKQSGSDVLDFVLNDSKLAQSINGFKYIQKATSGGWGWSDSDDTIGAKVELLSYDYNDTDKSITIGVRSTFSSAGETNKKTITTNFTVKAPEYADSTIDIYPVYDKKIITADGDLSIDAELPAVVDSTTGVPTNNFTKIVGDIWVRGTGETNGESTGSFNKYIGGITLTNTVMNLTGNMYTNRCLNLGDKAQPTISGDVYAVNAYLGPKEAGDTTNNELIITGDLITNNDLTLNSTNGKAGMANFYGINENTTTNITKPELAAKESSSIIINKENGNSLKINKAYIMGVAYLDTETKYQTGESIAVKGNYLAYTDILPGYEDRIVLKQYNPLQLMETIDGHIATLSEKARYFQEYYANTSKKVNASSIEINQVIATGAYVNDGKSSNGVLTPLTDTAVKAVMVQKRKAFASNVLCMGDITGVKIEEKLADELEIYNDVNIDVKKTVSSQINFGAIDTINIDNMATTLEQKIKSNGDVIINSDTIQYDGKTETFSPDTKLLISTLGDVTINGNTDININKNTKINAVIIAKGRVKIIGKSDLKGAIISDGDVLLQCDTGDEKLRSDMEALIIANGNIDISGKLNLKGNIITVGNIAISGSDVKNLTYDANSTRKTIASNYKIFSNVFVGSPKNESVNMGTNMYNVEDCITKGTWRILK